MMIHLTLPILSIATMNMHTNAWIQFASMPSCTRHSPIASCHRSINARSSRALHGHDDAPNPFPSLHGKTLVSVQDCIDAHLQQKRRDRQFGRLSNEYPNSLPRLQFIDASWYHRPDPITNILRNPSEEFQLGPRIPHSHRLDIDALATTHELFPDENPKRLPHMMPPPRLFALAMDAYGIRQYNSRDGDGGDFADSIVVYARRGAVFAPRTWFLFVSMGHDPQRVHWMQGSLEDWMESEGGEVEYGSLSEEAAHGVRCGEGYDDCFDRGILNVTKLYHSRYRRNAEIRYRPRVSRAAHVCDKYEVLQAVNEHLSSSSSSSSSNPKNKADRPSVDLSRGNSTGTVIIDTRGSGYARKGHMPSAIHLPYRRLVSPSNPLVLLPNEELHALFASRGIQYQDPNLKIILTCGSGVSVCHAFLALTVLGRNITEENTRVYDGSWEEWGRADEEEDLPKVLPGDAR